jgi:NDP-sugar pyrophosphorylase family protein
MNIFVHAAGDPIGASGSDRLLRVRAWWIGEVPASSWSGAQVVVAAGEGGELASWPGARCRPRVEQGAVASALRAEAAVFGEGPILVVDADRFEEFELRGLLTEHAASPAIATLVLRPGSADPAERRAEVERSGRILRIVPAARAPELPLALAGTALVEPEILVHVPEGQPFGLETDLFGLVLRGGGILSGWCCPSPGPPRRAGRASVGAGC